MAHRDAVGDGDRAEFAWRATRLFHAFLRGLRLAHERDVARRCLVPAGDDSDERLMDLGLRQAHRVVVGPVRRAFGTFGHVARRELGFVEFGHLLLLAPFFGNIIVRRFLALFCSEHAALSTPDNIGSYSLYT